MEIDGTRQGGDVGRRLDDVREDIKRSHFAEEDKHIQNIRRDNCIIQMYTVPGNWLFITLCI